MLREAVAALLHRDGALVVHHVGLDPQLKQNRVKTGLVLGVLSAYLVVLVVDHLSDEGLGLVGPGLGTGLAGGRPVS